MMQTSMQATEPSSRAPDVPPKCAEAFTNQKPSAPTRFTNSSEERVLSSRLPLKINVFYEQRSKGVRLCMSNCRSIEVAVVWPLYADLDSFPSEDLSSGFDFELEKSGNKDENSRVAMDADQEHTADLSLAANPTTITNSSPDRNQDSSTEETFRFLDLPQELRLKIYKYLLPPRHHKIATQIPHNGYFYNTSTIPLHSAQSFYPFGTQPPQNQKLTTYKVLTSNFHNDFPGLSIRPEILRVCKQIHAEAEPVLYGSNETTFDFGTYLDAAIAFFGDRSIEARGYVKCIMGAREIPAWLGRDAYGNDRVDDAWIKFCHFVKSELTGLRNLDLTLWSSTGSAASFPTHIGGTMVDGSTPGEEGEDEALKKAREDEQIKRLREWEYTASLLQVEGLEEARVTWWGLMLEEVIAVNDSISRPGPSVGGIAKGFGSWITGRMVRDDLVKEKMIRDGVVIEGVVVVPGLGLGLGL